MPTARVGTARGWLLSTRNCACTRLGVAYIHEIAVPDQDALISVEELAARIADSELRILDCRHDLFAPAAGRIAYREAHIPGAVYADLDSDLAAPVEAHTGRHPLPSVASCAENFSRMGIDSNSFVVVYDERSGAIAARAWWMLRWLGHFSTFLLDGGVEAWRSRNLPLESGDVRPVARRFSPQPQDDWTIPSEDLLPAMAKGMKLVDARAAKRFAGLEEPIDTRAGHIPGAINMPFERSLLVSGHWKSADELAALWSETLGESENEPWAAMCGSGVTACHLAVSAALAGRPAPRLYVGSWSEWIRDPSRPIARDPL